jgi:hypothetical protein
VRAALPECPRACLPHTSVQPPRNARNMTRDRSGCPTRLNVFGRVYRNSSYADCGCCRGVSFAASTVSPLHVFVFSMPTSRTHFLSFVRLHLFPIQSKATPSATGEWHWSIPVYENCAGKHAMKNTLQRADVSLAAADEQRQPAQRSVQIQFRRFLSALPQEILAACRGQ